MSASLFLCWARALPSMDLLHFVPFFNIFALIFNFHSLKNNRASLKLIRKGILSVRSILGWISKTAPPRPDHFLPTDSKLYFSFNFAASHLQVATTIYALWGWHHAFHSARSPVTFRYYQQVGNSGKLRLCWFDSSIWRRHQERCQGQKCLLHC